MRKITSQIVGAFNYRHAAKLANTESTGNALYLHGNKIAEWREDGLWITNAGWSSNTTKERLNGLRGVSIYQKDYQWYLNGKKWDGSWVNVSIQNRLEYLRGEIRTERISYGELAELQDLAEYIEDGDVELLEWAGISEGGEAK